MNFLIGLLTVVLVLNCAFLILLVLVQLPKKDAGAGMAFGGGATDALFGAGSGNMLTKITKYATISFFVLTMFVGLLQSNAHQKRTKELEKQLENLPAGTATIPAPAQPAVSTDAALPAPAPLSIPAPPEASNEPSAVPAEVPAAGQ